MKNKFVGLPESFINKDSEDFSKLVENYQPMNFDIKNQDDAAVIDIDGYIGSDPFMEFLTGDKSPNTVESLKNQLRSITANKIIVNINSPGGNLNDGIVIMDLLKGSKAEVITNLYGLSASAATIIHQGGTKRRMSKNSFELLHRVMLGTMGYFNQNSFLSLAEHLEPLDKRLISIYEEQSTSSRQEIIDLMDSGEGYGRFIDADTALAMGLIDEVFDPADHDEDTEKTQQNNNALLGRLSMIEALENLQKVEPAENQEKPDQTALNEPILILNKMKQENSNGLL